MADVFISYSRKDIAFARLLYTHFCENQLDVWIDWDRIPFGQDWRKEICAAIEGADVFMFILSQNSVGSNVCKDEIDQALHNHKRVVPVLIDDIPPASIREFVPELSQKNWIILRVGDVFCLETNPTPTSANPEDQWLALPKQPQFEAALQKLNQDIHTDWDWVRAHTRLQLRALEWDRSGRDASYLLRGEELAGAERWLDQAAEKNPQPTVLQVQLISISRQAETERQQEALSAQQEKLRLEQAANRRQRILLWVVGVGLMVAVMLGGLFLSQRNQYLAETHVRATAEANALTESHGRATAEVNALTQANQRATSQAVAEDQRNIAQAGQIAALALGRLDDRFDLALLLAGAAYQRQDTVETRRGLLDAVTANPGLDYFLYGHTDRIYALAFSPDGKRIASASADGSVVLWDTAARRQVGSPLTIPSTAVLSVAFSPDSRRLATGHCGKVDPSGICLEGDVVLWDAATGSRLGEMEPKPTTGILSLAFRGDGQLLASGDSSGEIRLWDTSSLQPAGKPFRVEAGSVLGLAFSPDQTRLLSAVRSMQFNQNAVQPVTYQGMLRVWNLTDPTAPALFQVCPSAYMMSVAFTTEGIPLGACDLGNQIDVWNVESHQPMILTGSSGLISNLAFSADGATLASGECGRFQSNGLSCIQGEVRLWDVRMGISIGQPLRGTSDYVSNLALTPDGHVLAANSPRIAGENTILVWSVSHSGALSSPVEGIPLPGAVTFSPDTHRFTVGSKDSILLFPASPQSTPLATLQGDPGQVTSLAYSPDGRVLASGDSDGSVYLWDPAGKKMLFGPLAGSQSSIASLAFTGDGRELVSVSERGELLTWDPASGTQLKKILDATDPSPTSLALSPDGKLLAGAFCVADEARRLDGTNCRQGEIRLWDTGSGQRIGASLEGHPYQVNSLAFSPDGRLLASAGCSHVGQAETCDQGEIRIWEVPTGRAVSGPLTEHTENVIGLAFSPDGEMLASFSDENRIILWDTSAWQSLGQIASEAESIPNLTNIPLVFSPDNQTLYTAANQLRQWVVGPRGWLGVGCRMANRDLTDAEWQSYLAMVPRQSICR